MKIVAKYSKITVVISILLIFSVMTGLISATAAEVPQIYGDAEYIRSVKSPNGFRYRNINCITNLSDDVKELVKSNSFTPEMNEFLEAYVKYNYYGLTEAEAISQMVRAGIIEYESLLPILADSLLRSFDPYGAYYSADYYFDDEETSFFYGYGIEIRGKFVDNGFHYGTYISGVMAGSPAEKAGICAGDVIRRVGDMDVQGLGLVAISALMSLDDRMEVTLIGSDGIEKTLKLQKEKFVRSVVSASILDEASKTVKITVENFTNSDIVKDFEALVAKYHEAGYKNIVIDLRDNTGGNVEYMYEMVDLLVPEKDKLLFSLRYNDGALDNTYSTGVGYKFAGVAVLVNGYTASAAEVFALTAREVIGAKLIGTKTYGKGVGQIYVGLSNGDTAAITAIEIVSSKGVRYHGNGLDPDYKISQRYKDTVREKPASLNFVNCTSISAVSKNNATLALNQRLYKCGYISKADVTDFCSPNTINAVEIFQEYHDLPVGIDKIDYNFILALNLLGEYTAPYKYAETDDTEDAAKLFISGGDAAIKQFISDAEKSAE